MTRAHQPSDIKLVFDEPKLKKKTPRHIADFSPEQRRELAIELGLPAFRANQVANHYFSHLNSSPETWSDIPADLRTTLAELFTPKLIELVRSVTCDDGMTRKDLWRLHDGVLVESDAFGIDDVTAGQEWGKALPGVTGGVGVGVTKDQGQQIEKSHDDDGGPARVAASPAASGAK